MGHVAFAAPARGRGILSHRGALLLAYLGAWTLVGLLAASQFVLTYTAQGNQAPVLRILQLTLPLWYAWAAVAPAVLWWAHRFPLEPGRWIPRLLAHVVALPVVGAVVVGVYLALRALFGAPSSRSFLFEYVNSLHTHAFTYLVLVLVVHAVRYYRGVRDRELRAAELAGQLADARLRALRAQLQPHFLFNTMHAISAWVREDPDAAEEMLAELAELLRAVLEIDDRHEVSLRREMELARRYLSIQEFRFGERLEVDIEVDPGVLDVRVPTLVLQPLVENAMRHGVAERVGGGAVTIRAAAAGDGLEILVVDDGPGMEASAEDPEAWGTGLGNTAERLRELYGSAGRLELRNLDPGLEARITLPLRRGGTPGRADPGGGG